MGSNLSTRCASLHALVGHLPPYRTLCQNRWKDQRRLSPSIRILSSATSVRRWRRLLSLDRLDETEKTLLAASKRKLEPPYTLLLRYYVAFLKKDDDAMKRQVALAQNRPDAEDWMTHSQALVAAYSGRLQLARGLSQRAVDLARQAGINR